MTTRNITRSIMVYALIMLLCGCDGMADLFHGAKQQTPPVAYTIAFNANGASGQAPAAQTVNAGTVVVLPDSGALFYAAKVFVGWSSNAMGTGATYAAGADLTVDANRTLYARWIAPGDVPQCTVTYDANGATGVPPASQTVYSGISITIPNQGTLSLSGKIFDGWNTAANGSGTNYAVGMSFAISANITLYAKWRSAVQYTVSYDANGATGAAPASQTVDPGTTITLPGAGGLSFVGRAFDGWGTAADGFGVGYTEGAPYTVNGNATLYAKWRIEIKYTVTFSANGATGAAPSAQTVDPGTEITLPGAGGLTYPNRTFDGWNTTAGGTGTAYAEGAPYTVNADATLYAQWVVTPVVPPGATLAEKLAYIAGRADDGAVYDVEIRTDESLAPTTLSTMGRNVTINLYSASASDIKKIMLSVSAGYLFTVSSNITLKLENIILQGSSANDVALIRVASGGKLEMYAGSEVRENISNNDNNNSGIFVDGGMLIMFDGKICNNGKSGWGAGGGVRIRTGTFMMYGGIISGNKGYNVGGGVYIESGGHFTKTGLSAGQTSGVIYGSDVGTELANSANNGKAAYFANNSKQRNTTLGGYDVISTENVNVGWE
jgi:uncharacterized repeat protein (TIGR02543 family)